MFRVSGRANLWKKKRREKKNKKKKWTENKNEERSDGARARRCCSSSKEIRKINECRRRVLRAGVPIARKRKRYFRVNVTTLLVSAVDSGNWRKRLALRFRGGVYRRNLLFFSSSSFFYRTRTIALPATGDLAPIAPLIHLTTLNLTRSRCRRIRATHKLHRCAM